MANKKTLALSEEQYSKIINTMVTGFEFEGKQIQPNSRIATALVIEANLGIRIGDVLNLHLTDIIKDGERFRLDVIEDKTEKSRTFTVPSEIYNFIKEYCLKNDIKETAKIFQLGERAVQKQLKLVCDFLGYKGISTHSFRKYFATNIYINNNYNIELVRQLLQHSVVETSQKYIGIGTKELETAIQNNVNLLKTF
ncbi:tyrosine-type recombinase/integrase [Clostridium chromiireducens]|uniref:Tyrosine-type recombinase/integrase n=1 Tax=Clostridium chromiireducens TaxID=225345 RepID=A0A964W2M0_9CLOT|nr:tyrosine-type recombinase/integrase [Clostridium chromiireducens]MVX64656.1 tyrosine-type recombinase/integrase [Clostridium chromiireducens]